MKYDAILIFGRGIGKDGSLPENIVSSLEKAYELFQQGVSRNLITSGKWGYSLDFTPPCTEAHAMAEYAKKLGFPQDAILEEGEASTTGSNCYFVKKLLKERGWKRILVITIPPIHTRILYNLKKVFGKGYKIKNIFADYRFPQDKFIELKTTEKRKMKDVRRFYKPLVIGDDEAIYKAAQEDFKANYMNKTSNTNFS